MAYTPPPTSLSRLGAITTLLAQATPVGKDITKTPKIFATLPGGQIFYDTDLELDTDGWPDGANSGDTSHQADTNLHCGGNAINANEVPYFVLPLPRPWFTDLGVSLGDYAAVIFQDKLAFAVFADLGPTKKLGEGSLELLRRLGQERLKPSGKVINAGMGPRVLTLVFPGSGDAAHRTDQATLLAAIEATARPLFEALASPAVA